MTDIRPDPSSSRQKNAAEYELLKTYGNVIGKNQASNIVHTVLSAARMATHWKGPTSACVNEHEDGAHCRGCR